MYETVKEYYGRTLQSTQDLKTTACCEVTDVPDWLKPLLGQIHPEVEARYYAA